MGRLPGCQAVTMRRTNLEGSGDPVSCAGCGRTYPAGDLVLLQHRRLCAACKHRTLSRHFAVRPTLLPAETGAAAPLGSDCSAHEGESAFAICEQCGDFMCPLCTTPYEGRFYCAAFWLLPSPSGFCPRLLPSALAFCLLLL